MLEVNDSAFYWEKFDENNNPIDMKVCQLSFNVKEGGKLYIIEKAKDDINYFELSGTNLPNLYGKLSSGKKFTLVNVKYSERDTGVVEFSRDCFEMVRLNCDFDYILYGDWYDIDRKINILSIRFSYLENFFKLSEVKRLKRYDNMVCGAFKKDEYYFKSSTKEHEILLNLGSEINQKSSFSSLNYEFFDYLSIAKKDDISLEEVIDLGNIFKSFFEFLSFNSEVKIFVENLNFRNDGNKIEIFYKQKDYIKKQSSSFYGFLFDFNDIKDNFILILNNWVKNFNKNKNEYQAFYNVISTKEEFNIYTHYFQIVSSLESYHRINNVEKDNEFNIKHNEYVSSLLQKLDGYLNSKEKSKLKYKIGKSIGVSFKDRIKSLIQYSNIKNVLKLEDAIQFNIIDFICETRNSIAHLKEELNINDKILSSFEYLKLLILLIVLKDQGLVYLDSKNKILNSDLEYTKKKLIINFE